MPYINPRTYLLTYLLARSQTADAGRGHFSQILLDYFSGSWDWEFQVRLSARELEAHVIGYRKEKSLIWEKLLTHGLSFCDPLWSCFYSIP